MFRYDWPLSLSEEDRSENFSIGISVLIFVLAISHQFGLNYHFSLGAIGLYIILVMHIKRLLNFNVYVGLALSVGVLLSYWWVIVRYGYAEWGDTARVMRYMFCMFAFSALIGQKLQIRPPPTSLIAVASFVLVAVALYQGFIDRSAQINPSLFALGENTGFTEDQQIYRYYENSIRVNSIYSEASVYGMMLVCLFAALSGRLGRLAAACRVALVFAAAISGSGLAAVGMAGALLLQGLRRGNTKNFALYWAAIAGGTVGLFALFGYLSKSYDFELFDRLAGGAASDTSAQARVFGPFVLIWENLANGDIFGIPVNSFSHFFYTGAYLDLDDYPGHNGILSTLIHFGLIGVLALGWAFNQVRGPLALWMVLIIGSQSGNFFSYEKVFLMLYFSSLVSTLNHNPRSQ
jgi:hypothetical protein